MHLWARARYDLHLGEDEFWKLTPRQLAYLDRRYELQIDRAHFLAGIISCTVANYSMFRPDELFKPSDFMPGMKQQEPTEEELVMGLNAALMPLSTVKR